MTVVAPLREGSGTRIGPYKLLQLIGEGGFGSVFMAEQEKPVARRGALKIIKLGMDTNQVVARFEQERQALAMMDHPNIAKVLDAGATDTGRPFFVMELVKGDPIAEYADKHSMSMDERLALFAQVCNAVQHAHTKGVIRRDIKPSNVLVSTQDGKPHAKVIDFGIAKATLSKLTERTLFTEHRQLIGTPEYMSPEQAEGSLDIDTRTDMYSLGVLLYELLTGTTPFTSHELRSAAYAEIQRIIREVEPPKPSTRLSDSAEMLASVASFRRIEPKRVSVLVRGELDWIVMKAMEKDRQRRYETPSGLAADVQRYLAGEAVVAAPPSNVYRLRTVIRRNKGPVAAGGAVAAVLVLGLIGTSVGLFRAERARAGEAEQRKQAESARAEAVAQEAKAREQEAEAKRQAEIAEAVAKFQTEMLAAVDPNQLPKDPVTNEPIRDAVTVLQTLRAAVKVLDEGGSALKDQPLVEARVRDTVGSTLRSLARYDEAESNLRRSLELRSAALPAGHPDIATSLHNLAASLREQRKLAEAEPLFREALAIRRATLPAGDRAIAFELNSLGVLRQAQGNLVEAEAFMREALAIQRGAQPAGQRDIAVALNNLAGILRNRGKTAEAEPLLREALAMIREVSPAGHPEIAITLNFLATLLLDEERLAEAEPLYREALEIRRAAFPAGHPDIAESLSNLARLLQAKNSIAEAEPLFREALAIYRAAYPAGHPTVAATLSNLARSLRDQSKCAEAEPLYRDALDAYRAVYPAEHPNVAIGLNNLATLYVRSSELDKSISVYRKAIRMQEKALGRSHPNTLVIAANLGVVYKDAGRFAEAIPLLEEVYEASKREPSIAWIGGQLLEGYTMQADPAKPESIAKVVTLVRELLAQERAELPEASPVLAGQLIGYSQSLLRVKAWDAAEAPIREALSIRERTQPDALSTFNTRSMLGGVLLGQEKIDEAEPLLLGRYQGLKDREATIPPQAKVRVQEALERLVKLYEAKGDEAKAAAWRSELDAAKAEQTKTEVEGDGR